MTDPQEAALTDLATGPTTAPAAEPEIDAELLEEAQRQISAASPNAAINEALKLLVETARAKRQAAGEALYRMVERGELDFRRLDGVDE